MVCKIDAPRSEYLFPTQIALGEIKDFSTYQQDLIDWIYEYERKDHGDMISNRGGNQSESKEIFTERSFRRFKNKIINGDSLEELKKEKGELVRKLDVSTQMNNSIDYEFEEKDFRLSMLEDQMASEKLSEGITGFSKAIEELEELLLKRYSEIKNHKLISAN